MKDGKKTTWGSGILITNSSFMKRIIKHYKIETLAEILDFTKIRESGATKKKDKSGYILRKKEIN